MKDVEREFLLAFWKIHVLHHAGEAPVVGQWVIRELREHGYEVSPGTLYPLLARMEERGWLRSKTDPDGGPRARREYSLTSGGREVLALLRRHVSELYREMVHDEKRGRHGRPDGAAPSPRGVKTPRRPSGGRSGPRA